MGTDLEELDPYISKQGDFHHTFFVIFWKKGKALIFFNQNTEEMGKFARMVFIFC